MAESQATEGEAMTASVPGAPLEQDVSDGLINRDTVTSCLTEIFTQDGAILAHTESSKTTLLWDDRPPEERRIWEQRW